MKLKITPNIRSNMQLQFADSFRRSLFSKATEGQLDSVSKHETGKKEEGKIVLKYTGKDR